MLLLLLLGRLFRTIKHGSARKKPPQNAAVNKRQRIEGSSKKLRTVDANKKSKIVDANKKLKIDGDSKKLRIDGDNKKPKIDGDSKRQTIVAVNKKLRIARNSKRQMIDDANKKPRIEGNNKKLTDAVNRRRRSGGSKKRLNKRKRKKQQHASDNRKQRLNDRNKLRLCWQCHLVSALVIRAVSPFEAVQGSAPAAEHPSSTYLSHLPQHHHHHHQLSKRQPNAVPKKPKQIREQRKPKRNVEQMKAKRSVERKKQQQRNDAPTRPRHGGCSSSRRRQSDVSKKDCEKQRLLGEHGSRKSCVVSERPRNDDNNESWTRGFDYSRRRRRAGAPQRHSEQCRLCRR